MTVFCQGNKDQLTAVATYQHSEQECKSALMQMSYVFGVKTDGLYTNPPPQHNSLYAIWTPVSPPILYSNMLAQTLLGHNLKQSERNAITDSIIFLLHTQTKDKNTLGSSHTNKLLRKKTTYLSVMASASKYWFIKSSFPFSSHSPKRLTEIPGAGVTTGLQER